MYDKKKKSKNEVEDKETETRRAHANGERYLLRESSKRMITIIGRREVSTGEGYWRGPVWNCRNKIQLLLPLSTSQMTKILEQCLCIATSPPPHLFFSNQTRPLQSTQHTTFKFNKKKQPFSYFSTCCIFFIHSQLWVLVL